MIKMPLKKSVFLLYFLLIVKIAGFSQNQNDKTFEVLKNLEIFSTTYKQLHLHYVDETQPGKLIKTAIDAMLQSLDPYTVYIPEANIEDLRLFTEGSYEGIGTLIMSRDGKIFISGIHEGYSAHKAGLMVGDQILAINGADLTNRTNDDVSALLKGQANTALTLTIQRIGEHKPIEKTLIREAIKLKNVSYFAILADHVGYIKLDGFTEGAANEVKEAFLKLKADGATSLILDLRGNGGGLMNEATDIVNLFVDRGLPIVSMKGKVEARNQSFSTRNEPIDRNIPIVVLIDRTSASASEIVAGALQDYDRAVIVGQRSFGKGLVQNILPLEYNAQLKITTAKYYIPSGRCVQALDYADRDDEGRAKKVPDSLRTAFKTKGGRVVYDGDGIEPDIEIEPKIMSHITATLFIKYHFFDFANLYHHKHKTLPKPSEFVVSDHLFNEFKSYLSDKDTDYKTQTEIILEELEKAAKEEKYFDAIKKDLEHLKTQLFHDKDTDMNKNKDEIKHVLGLELVIRYYYQKGIIEFALRNDKAVQKAIEILNDLDVYGAILR
ncbi:MAG: S41 family peptidase [Bacteroidales bacterium]|nr:S41 family peptidase [Bacteroidales bacterium]